MRKKRKLTQEHKQKLSKQILQYTLDGDFIREWKSIKEAQDTLGIYNISFACSGKLKKSGGFKWEYKTSNI